MSEPVAWIQPDHLQKARQAPFLCRIEPTQRCADFVPLYLHPAPDHREVMRQALDALEVGRRYVYADDRPQLEDAIDGLRAALGEKG